MIGLTPRQAELLEFLRAYVKRHGISPTFQEIAVEFGLTSRSSAKTLLFRLESRGFIRCQPGRARSIELLPTKDHHTSDCNCDECARRRYQDQLKIVQGLGYMPDGAVARANLIGLRPAANAAELLGLSVSPAPRCISAAVLPEVS